MPASSNCHRSFTIDRVTQPKLKIANSQQSKLNIQILTVAKSQSSAMPGDLRLQQFIQFVEMASWLGFAERCLSMAAKSRLQRDIANVNHAKKKTKTEAQ